MDLLPISPRSYADEDAWFGKIANPEGRGKPASREGGHAPAEEPVFKGLALPPGMLTGNVQTAGPTTPAPVGNVD
ncbi:hypothetical protein [Crystallibacter degradans]|uniref:hypothetical protein n=1 Tax=Crystallibacter degradans TaxID=2726743 RepID=UPI0014752077|nr:hypothetical protein [Arthrobacter sp. SF27]NMR32061.1 hypothetical protein [Arthrobacter sp. SF27]